MPHQCSHTAARTTATTQGMPIQPRPTRTAASSAPSMATPGYDTTRSHGAARRRRARCQYTTGTGTTKQAITNH